MTFVYVILIPLIIVFFSIKKKGKFGFENMVKGLNLALIPLVFYITVMYLVEWNTALHTGWKYFTVLTVFVPFVFVVLLLNIVRLVGWLIRKRK